MFFVLCCKYNNDQGASKGQGIPLLIKGTPSELIKSDSVLTPVL